MRIRTWASQTALVFALAIGCTAAPVSEEEPVGTSEQELIDVAGLPVPSKTAAGVTTRLWREEASALWFADALAICSSSDRESYGGAINDDRVTRVRGLMTKVLSDVGDPAVTSWIALRNRSDYNVRPLSKAPVGAGLTPRYPGAYRTSSLPGFVANTAAREKLQIALDAIAVNLCIARAVDEQAMLGTTLLLPSADQREVQQIVRERAQIAMLNFANLAESIALPDGAVGALDPAVSALRDWSDKPEAIARWREWGDDFADSVRLHVQATERLAQLLVRSASARDPLPGRESLPSSDDWVAGSWRQRALAALFGGDPLTASAPGVAATLAPNGTAQTLPWPTRDELAYASPGLWTPAVARLVALARARGALSLVLRPGADGYSGPEDIDLNSAAEWLYRDLEADLRTAGCATFVNNGSECATVTGDHVREPLNFGASAGDSALGAFRMWTQHQLRPADALGAVRAIVDILPRTSRAGGMRIVGGTRVDQLPGRAAKSLVFGEEATFAGPPLLEFAAAFSRYGRHRIPSSLGTTTSSTGQLAAPLFGGESLTMESTRRLGAVPALGSTQMWMRFRAGSGREAVRAALHRETSVNRAIGVAIGSRLIEIAPQEIGTAVAGNLGIVHHVGSPGTHAWSVRFDAPDADEYWRQPNVSYTLIALPATAAASNALIDPASERAGFASIATLVAAAGDSRMTSLTRDPTTGLFRAGINLVDGEAVILVVGRRVGRRMAYRPITAAFTPAVTSGAASIPVDSRLFAAGGVFGTLAQQIVAVRSSDPSRPRFDGFGQEYEREQERASESAAPDATLADFSRRKIAEASSNQNAALSSLTSALQELRNNQLGEVDVRAARARQVGTTRATLGRLCGPAGENAGSLDDHPSAEQACGVSTVAVPALGFPTEEHGRVCGAFLPLTPFQPAPPPTRVTLNWQTSTRCSRDSAEGRTVCLLNRLAEQLDFRVEVAKPAACSANAGPAASFEPVGGAMAERMLKQRNALQAYRDRVRELEAAGRVMLVRAKAADEARAIADAHVELARIRADVAERQGLTELAERSRALEMAQQRLRGALSYEAAVTGYSERDAATDGLGVLGAAGSAAATGAAIGAAGGPIGAAGGAAIGAIAAAGSTVLRRIVGASDEERRSAQNAVNESVLAVQKARESEQQYAEYFGLCVKNPQEAARDPRATQWGACPLVPGAPGTVLAAYAQEKLIAEMAASRAGTEAVLAANEAQQVMRDRLGATRDAARILAAESQGLRLDLEAAQIALAEARLEGEIAATRAEASFAISQAFHGTKLWEAQGLLESARRSALDARRAVEFSYVTDLSTISRDQPMVRAPRLWADQVYDYDLAPLRAVGLTVGAPSADTISENKLANYISNLSSYATAVLTDRGLRDESNVLTLASIPGPAARLESPDDPFVTVPHPVANSWQVLCPPRSLCAPEGGYCSLARTGNIRTTCAAMNENGATEYLRAKGLKLAFTLDAWGGFGRRATTTEQTRNLNGRWNRFVVNLRGPNITTCEDLPVSERPFCRNYSNRVPFILRHNGPFVVLNENGQLGFVRLSEAAVSGDASVSINPGLDPLYSALDLVPLVNIRRHGFWGYPLGGEYELALELTPDKELAQIEAVEILSSNMFRQPTR